MTSKLFSTSTIELFRSYSTDDFINDNIFCKIVYEGPDSEQTLEILIQELPDKKNEIEIAKGILLELKTPSFKVSDDIKREQWQNILNRQKKQHRLYLLRIAASVIILLSLSATMLYFFSGRTVTEQFSAIADSDYRNTTLILNDGREITLSDSKSTDVKYADNGRKVAVNDSLKIEQSEENHVTNKMIVPFGKRSTLLLSDGTRVWLNSGTIMTFPPKFSGKTRDIYIQGEGYFEVAKNEAMPFIVHTDSFNVKVIGTRFDIRAYKDDDEVSATLLEGKISMNFKGDSPANELFLSPTYKAALKGNKRSIYLSKVDHIENTITWIDGFMNFTDEEFSVVLKHISKYYNINIELQYKSRLPKIYGKLDLKDDPELVMQVLALLSNTRYSKAGNKYMFSD